MMYERPRIVYVIPSLDLGGTERQLVNLVRGLHSEFDLEVVCTGPPGELAPEVRRHAPVRALDARGGWDFRIHRRAARVLREFRPHIVHSFLFGFDYAVNAAARELGVPVVISSRRELASWMRPRHVRAQQRANELVDCVVANSRAVADFAIQLENANPALFRVIYGGIRVDSFKSSGDPAEIRERFRLPQGNPLVGMVANFSPVKDHALFLAMAAELAAARPDIHFVLVGDGPLRDPIGREIARRGLEGRVSGLRTATEMPDVYKVLAVSVLCSKSEGFPNALLESMAAGVPVVAAAVGGVPELVEHEHTGLLVHSRDPAGFARAVLRVLDHQDEAAARAQRAGAVVRERFSLNAMLDAHCALYLELLETKRGAR